MELNNNNNEIQMKRIDEEGLAVHSQVIKIKQEIEKIKHPSLETELYMRRLKDVKRLQSRSPLGLSERTIILGHS
ncbi:hypothetical protein L195_g044249 [Trifolium pratense]|uniref:Uncharacterized protein n=2 Tax=Trifolium pratense TaxID=57577 RepID=A0ACB0M441_TRIPR|nr:hypothetical protein L195_g044249 [Trifolium pratense]CAJ2676076.1 unnamed protein product [Trifolium pratense]